MKRYLFAVAAAGLAALATYTPQLHAEANVLPAIRLAVVGDMACDSSNPEFGDGKGTSTHCREMRVSSMIKKAANPWRAVLGLGDFQYDCGDPADYKVSYNPSFGRLDALMHPTPGNHEYKTGTDVYGVDCPTRNDKAGRFFARFGKRSHPRTHGRYSFDIGSWHFISLNANCNRVGGCGGNDPATTWLTKDLKNTHKRCIAAFWHQPLYAGVGSGYNSTYKPWWDALNAVGADLVLNGHVHNYQRFAPMDPSKNRTSRGITEYVVGTGGETQVGVASGASPQPVAHQKAFGFLRLRLTTDGWHSRFLRADGAVVDKHAGTCH